jgi:hypothetical protein
MSADNRGVRSPNRKLGKESAGTPRCEDRPLVFARSMRANSMHQEETRKKQCVRARACAHNRVKMLSSYFEEATPERVHAAITRTLVSLGLALLSAYVCVYALSVGAPAFVLWLLGVFTFGCALCAAFMAAAARVLGWDMAHPLPDVDDDTRGFRGPRPRPVSPRPLGGNGPVDWEKFERDLNQYAQRSRSRSRSREKAGAGMLRAACLHPGLKQVTEFVRACAQVRTQDREDLMVLEAAEKNVSEIKIMGDFEVSAFTVFEHLRPMLVAEFALVEDEVGDVGQQVRGLERGLFAVGAAHVLLS